MIVVAIQKRISKILKLTNISREEVALRLLGGRSNVTSIHPISYKYLQMKSYNATVPCQGFPQMLRTWGGSSKFDGGWGLSQYMGGAGGGVFQGKGKYFVIITNTKKYLQSD